MLCYRGDPIIKIKAWVQYSSTTSTPLLNIKTLDFPAVIVLGHPNYYAKFGHQPASDFGITAPFDIPDGVLRVWCLGEVADIPQGEIAYAKAFGI